MLLIEFERSDTGDITVRILDPRAPTGGREATIAERVFQGGLPGLQLTAPENFTILRLEATTKCVTPFADWRKQHPDAHISEWLNRPTE